VVVCCLVGNSGILIGVASEGARSRDNIFIGIGS